MNAEEQINGKYNLKFSRKNALTLLKECLESVIDFCFHDTQYHQAELQNEISARKPNAKRQKILREQGFLYLMAQIVEYAFPMLRNLEKVIEYLYFYHKILFKIKF